MYYAPFDVQLPNKKGEVLSVPDLCVIRDANKLNDKGCFGALDLVMEIALPRNTKREMKNKLALYQKVGVIGYCVIHPTEKSVFIFYKKENISYCYLFSMANFSHWLFSPI